MYDENAEPAGLATNQMQTRLASSGLVYQEPSRKKDTGWNAASKKAMKN
jgi:hypothetical protein